jgi:hypothetical protein
VIALPRWRIRASVRAALAQAPAIALPAEIVARAKTGFTVPTGTWMGAAAGNATVAVKEPAFAAKGLMSRQWSQAVMHGFA